MDYKVWIEASVSWGILASQVVRHYCDTNASLVGCLHELSVNICFSLEQSVCRNLGFFKKEEGNGIHQVSFHWFAHRAEWTALLIGPHTKRSEPVRNKSRKRRRLCWCRIRRERNGKGVVAKEPRSMGEKPYTCVGGWRRISGGKTGQQDEGIVLWARSCVDPWTTQLCSPVGEAFQALSGNRLDRTLNVLIKTIWKGGECSRAMKY
jgi:hypothetical protein